MHSFFSAVTRPKDADLMPNIVDTDQTSPSEGEIIFKSAQCAHI